MEIRLTPHSRNSFAFSVDTVEGLHSWSLAKPTQRDFIVDRLQTRVVRAPSAKDSVYLRRKKWFSASCGGESFQFQQQCVHVIFHFGGATRFRVECTVVTLRRAERHVPIEVLDFA